MNYIFSRWLIAALLWATINHLPLSANSDSVTIRVHFLHGSKPSFKFRHEEDRWFGGILGGHAGVEYEPGKIINFLPHGRFHVFAQPQRINSHFRIHDTISFYEILGSNTDSVKKTMVCIRISSQQKARLDTLVATYTRRSPYDYAFFGMRCGAAAYDLLALAGIVECHSFSGTWSRFFYPRKTRRYLEKLALRNGYGIQRLPGSHRRIWEKD